MCSKFKVYGAYGWTGTGKTTTTLAIIEVFKRMGRKILLAAPTGRAAKECRKLQVWSQKLYTVYWNTNLQKAIKK